jgi:hypothetical protein
MLGTTGEMRPNGLGSTTRSTVVISARIAIGCEAHARDVLIEKIDYVLSLGRILGFDIEG